MGRFHIPCRDQLSLPGPASYKSRSHMAQPAALRSRTIPAIASCTFFSCCLVRSHAFCLLIKLKDPTKRQPNMLLSVVCALCGFLPWFGTKTLGQCLGTGHATLQIQKHISLAVVQQEGFVLSRPGEQRKNLVAPPWLGGLPSSDLPRWRTKLQTMQATSSYFQQTKSSTSQHAKQNSMPARHTTTRCTHHTRRESKAKLPP